MAFDFPAAPTLGQVYTSGSASYIWTGTSWDKQTAAIYVFKAGDTMTGPLALPFDPVLNLEAATKQYVDGGMTGLDDKVDVAGDVMTGFLTLSADPTDVLHAATKQYVDAAATAADPLYVNVVGDTMTGALAIALAGPALRLTKPLAADTAALAFETATVPRWTVGTDAETGADAGSDLLVECFTDAGAALGRACRMERATQVVHFDQVPTAVTIPLVQDVPMDGTQYARQDRTWAPIVLTDYVEIAGDTMTGDLTLPATTPTLPLHATTKQYVDGVVAAGGLYRGLWSVATNVPDLTPAVMNPVDGWSWMAQTVDPLVPELAPAALPGIGGQTIVHGDMIQWSTTGAAYARIPGTSLSITEADARYVNVPGDTMTGPLLLAADPVDPLEAATKQYIDSGLDLKVDVAGDTMIGPLLLPSLMPTAAVEATHKQYVDEAISAQSLYQGVWQPGPNIPDLTPAVANPLHSYSWIAQTSDPLGTETPPAGIPGLSGLAIGSADTVIWNATLATYEIVRSPAAASGFLPITGGTMTGSIAMGDAVGLHWASTSAQTDPMNFSEGICLYGYGGASQFGFSITSGTLNYCVQNGANLHKFRVGGNTPLEVRATAVLIGDTTASASLDVTGHIQSNGGGVYATGCNVIARSGGVFNFQTNDNNNWKNALNCGTMHIQYKQGGNNDGVFQLWTANGGYTDTYVLYTTIVSGGPGIYVNGNVSCASVTDRGAAAGKHDIRDTTRDEVLAAFAALQPKRFRKNAPPKADKPDAWEVPAPSLRYGFVVDDIVADPATQDLATLVYVRGTNGRVYEPEGTDIMQVLALTVARLKLLEAEVAALQAAA